MNRSSHPLESGGEKLSVAVRTPGCRPKNLLTKSQMASMRFGVAVILPVARFPGVGAKVVQPGSPVAVSVTVWPVFASDADTSIV